jgi:O-antigen/teichoic acid export membrane protein
VTQRGTEEIGPPVRDSDTDVSQRRDSDTGISQRRDSDTDVSQKKVAASAIWRATETAGTEAVAFGVFTLLAHLLAPEDFGAVALAGSILTMLQGLLYHGFTEALIQRAVVSDAHHRTALAANFVFAALLVALGLAAAWPLGWVFGRPEFPYVFAALVPSLLLRGLSSPMLAALRRDMDFRSIAIRTLLGVLIGGGIAVWMAHRGVGYWALVAQQWSVEVVGFVVLAAASPSKPWRLRWHTASLRELLPVALPVMGAQFLSNAARRLDTVALGVFMPNRAIGIYFMVYRLVFAAQMVTQHGLSEVAMVVLSSINTDAERYRRGLLRALRLMTYLCACGFGLLAVAGPWLVPLLFGAAWQPATAPLRILAALSTGGAVVSIAGVILVASGHATTFSRLAIGTAFLQLVAVGISARWGLVAVAWAAGLAQCAAVIPALMLLARHYQLTWSSLVAELLPIGLTFGLALGTAYELNTLREPWVAHTAGTGAFIAIMGIGALVLLRRDRRIARESELAIQPVRLRDL